MTEDKKQWKSRVVCAKADNINELQMTLDELAQKYWVKATQVFFQKETGLDQIAALIYLNEEVQA